jgi:hypothetical protein
MRIFIICTVLSRIIRMIKPRRMRLAGHIAYMGEESCPTISTDSNRNF